MLIFGFRLFIYFLTGSGYSVGKNKQNGKTSVSGKEKKQKKTKTDFFQLPPELLNYTKTSCMMMVWPFATILRDNFFGCVLVTAYLDNGPFGILTGKAILRKPLRKKTTGTRIFFFFFSAHRWTKPVSELVSWFFQYSN